MDADYHDSLFINSMTLKGENKEPNIQDIKRKATEIDFRISQLQKELEELVKERSTIRERLQALQDNETIPPILAEKAKIPPASSGYDKAAFLLELFSPRHDIYATREQNKAGKTVYYPKCINFWAEGCYRKNPTSKGVACNDCPLNSKAELTPSVIKKGNFLNKSLDGKGAIGIYPLKPGNLTRFVAIDLDESDWKEAAASILKTARELGIAMAVERSFSGNGAHLWIFFSEDLPAIDARKLAMLLIDRTREKDSSIDISSYDRLFPSQDTLSGNGYGNLILLPLVASAVSRGCTLFLDDDFNPYPLKEQLPYLSSIHRHSFQELKIFLKTLETDVFKLESPTEEQLNPSWSKWIPRISKADIHPPLIIYRSSGISFDKKAISLKAQEALRRIATVSNPEYYKELNKRDGSIFGINSRIALYEENDRVIKLPRALFETITKMFISLDIPYEVEDHRTSGTGLDAELKVSLRPYQKDALGKTKNREYGIIAAATGSGKTIIALAIIAEKKERTLIIVNSKALMDQWKTTIQEAMDIKTPNPESKRKNKRAENSPIGTLGGSKGDKLTGIVDVAMLQSLLPKLEKDGSSVVAQYGLVIVDECHHIAAEKSREALRQLNARYVYGLSATPKRADGLERIVYAECGNVLFRYEAAKLAYARGLSQYFILRFVQTTSSAQNKKPSFTETLNAIACDDKRNDVIVKDIREAYLNGRYIIVLTRRIEQNEEISKRLTNLNISNTVLSSSIKEKKLKDKIAELRMSKQHNVLIATDKLLGEGIDIPYLDTLFLASPFMQDTAIQQFAGRLSREYEGKEDTLIYDYVDFMIPRLSYMYAKRLSAYRKLGYIPKTNTDIPSPEMLFDDITFLDTFLEDISQASSSIVISASYIVTSKITNEILDALKQKSMEGLKILIAYGQKNIEHPAILSIGNRLKDCKINFVPVESIRNYSLIDENICWFGDFSLLGQSQKTQGLDERRSMLRIINKELARSLIQHSN